ncbi:LexA family protein [uncultured Sphingomonas sp.]
MTDAGIADGDLVVVSRAIEARPGDIVVVLLMATAR